MKVALIPARSGSRRIVGKNIIEIGGHPLIAYSIVTALESRVFDQVVVSTDSEDIARIATRYGAVANKLRPKVISGDLSPDIDWVTLAIDEWLDLRDEDCFSILRPTSPLRSVGSIRTAMKVFTSDKTAHSLRAVRSIREHPKKVWRRNGDTGFIDSYLPSLNETTGVESHSSPMQALDDLLVQDASLEICQVWVARRLRSLTGTRVLAFEMPGLEGLDINYPDDINYLRFLIASGKTKLAPIKIEPFGR